MSKKFCRILFVLTLIVPFTANATLADNMIITGASALGLGLAGNEDQEASPTENPEDYGDDYETIQIGGIILLVGGIILKLNESPASSSNFSLGVSQQEKDPRLSFIYRW